MADPLLLLPGLMCDARLWGPLQERLWDQVPERDRYAGAHVAALRHLLGGGGSLTLNCGYGHGHSVLAVLRAVLPVRTIGALAVRSRVLDVSALLLLAVGLAVLSTSPNL